MVKGDFMIAAVHNESQPFCILRVVDTVIRGISLVIGKKANLFVITDRNRKAACPFRKFSNFHIALLAVSKSPVFTYSCYREQRQEMRFLSNGNRMNTVTT